jgi:hypothetical protein
LVTYLADRLSRQGIVVVADLARLGMTGRRATRVGLVVAGAQRRGAVTSSSARPRRSKRLPIPQQIRTHEVGVA